MRRRALLSTLAAGSTVLAGCATSAGGDPGDASTTQGDDTTTDPKDETTEADDGDDDSGDAVGWPPELAVADLETQSRALSLFPTHYLSDDGGRVTVSFDATATADHPARVAATLENDEEFGNVFRLNDHEPLRPRPVFAPGIRDGYGPDGEVPAGTTDLYLVPLPDQSLPLAAPDVERDDDGVWRLADRPEWPWFPETTRLDAGERVTVEFAVVGSPTGSGPFASARRRSVGRHTEDALTLAAWNTDDPGPAAESAFAGESFPDLPGDDDTGESAVAWYHEADPSQRVFLQPSVERTDLPRTLDFDLVNHATEHATGNPAYWSLYRLVDGDWQKLEPRGYALPMGYVWPGDTRQYRLRAANGEALPCSDGKTTGYLGGGTFALEVGMSVESRTHAAVFEVDAPPVEFSPVDGVETERDGDTVTATDDRWREDSGRGVVEVTRAAADDEDAARVVSPELAARRHYFRNALPLFADGVATVRLRTSDGVADDAADVGVISYRGSTFRVDGSVESR